MSKGKNKFLMMVILLILVLSSAGCNKIVVESGNDSLVATTYGEFYITINSDGSINIVGEPDDTYDFSNWLNIKSVIGSYSRIVGLKNDGTVVATGNNDTGACEVEAWSDIKMIAATMRTTYGLKSDGTIIFTGEDDIDTVGYTTRIKENVTNWRDIVYIDASDLGLAGVTNNGSVMIVSEKEELEEEVKTWEKIISISIEHGKAIGLKDNGEVLICELPPFGKQVVCAYPYEDFYGAVKVDAGSNVFVCLMSDGKAKAISGLEIPEDYKYSGLYDLFFKSDEKQIIRKYTITRLQRNIIDVACFDSTVILLNNSGGIHIQ